jgi:hypothetical protein
MLAASLAREQPHRNEAHFRRKEIEGAALVEVVSVVLTFRGKQHRDLTHNLCYGGEISTIEVLAGGEKVHLADLDALVPIVFENRGLEHWCGPSIALQDNLPRTQKGCG